MISKKEMEKIMENFNSKEAPIVAQGKSKVIYETSHPDVCLMGFKPSLRSITNKRQGLIAGTEIERMHTTLFFMQELEDHGISTQLQYPELIDYEGQLIMAVKKVKPTPIEWIARFSAAGSIVKMFPTIVKKGQKFHKPLYKFDLKQDLSVCGIDDPMLNESYIVGFGLLSAEQLETAKEILKKSSDLVNEIVTSAGMDLIDMKMELGHDNDGNLLVIDEISQDCTRIEKKGVSMTKDCYREWKPEEVVLQRYKDFTRLVGAIK